MYEELKYDAREAASKLAICSRDVTKATGAMYITDCTKALDELEKMFRDCKNELCLQCGKYIERYKGSCSDCRWR